MQMNSTPATVWERAERSMGIVSCVFHGLSAKTRQAPQVANKPSGFPHVPQNQCLTSFIRENNPLMIWPALQCAGIERQRSVRLVGSDTDVLCNVMQQCMIVLKHVASMCAWV